MAGRRPLLNRRRTRYAHVLLDFDRTLNDSDRVFAKRLDGFLGLSGDEVLRHWGRIHREVLARQPARSGDADYLIHRIAVRLSRESPERIRDELKERIHAAWAECWDATELYDDSIPFLCRMREAGYALHIATGDYARRKAGRIEEQAARAIFDSAFDEETLGVGKGKRDYYDRILGRLGVSPQDVALVGDSLKNDIAPGIEAGLATVWVRRKRERRMDSIRPHLTVGSLTDALRHFLELIPKSPPP